MNEGRSGRSLPLLVIALLLALPIALSLVSPDPNDAGPFLSSIEFDEDVIFERGPVFKDHHVSYALPPEVRDMVVSDLTGDGVADVAVANRTSIFVYRGSGDGSLDDSPQTLTRPGMGDVRCLAVGDLDKDGRDDIAVTYTDGGGNNPKVTIFYQGSGFATARDIGTYPNPHQVVIGRFNNTINNDLAIACGGDPKINVNANITLVRWPFTNPWDMVQISVPGHSDLQLLTVGFDGSDSRLDLVAADLGGDTVTVLTQPLTFSSSWSRRSMEIGGSVTSLQMVNLTGGGLRDLAVVNSAHERVEIRVNPGTGIPVLATAIYDQVEGVSSMSFGRVTGTNLPDMALLSSGDGTCRLYPRHNGVLDKNVYIRFPVNGGPLKVVALDLGSIANGIYVLANGTAGSLPTLEHYFLLEGSVGNADGNVFPDEGRLTVVSAGNLSFDALVSIVEGEDRVLVSDLSGDKVSYLPTRSGPCDLHIDDLDGDLIDDLAVLNGGDGSISIYRGGAGLLTKNVPDVNITLVLSSPCSLTGGWIGALDEKVLVVGGGEGIEVIHDPLSNPLHETVGTATAGNRTDVAMGLLTSKSATGGIAALNADTGRVEVYFVRSDATAGDCYHTTPSAWLNMVGRYPTSIAIGDLDGDGREDVASGTSSGQVRLFMNSALGFYNDTPSSSSLSVPGQVERLHAGDLNDDGLDDLAVCYSNLPQIGLFLSQWPSFSNNIQFTAGGPAADVHVADIDGDQRDDLVATSAVSGALSFWTQRNMAPCASTWFSTLAPYEGTGLGYSAINTTDSSSDRASLAYLWDFGDGTTSDSVSGQHTYLSNGPYDGYLEVTDRAGATDRVEFHLDVLDVRPIASFTVSSTHPREGSQVWFNDTSLHYDEIAHIWDFGDGGPTVTAQNTVHVFSSDGTYNVTLTVRENDGGVDQYVRTITVEDGTPLSAILVGTTRVEEGKMASFFGDPRSYPDNITAYRWDFGDGTPDVTTRDAQHMFVANGSYVVTLTVWDDDGDMSSANITVTVHDQLPMASFTVPTTEVLEGDTVLFTDTSYAYDGIASWHWDLGDGRSLNTRNASVTYLDPGTYLVALTITESEGVTSTANRTIHVLASHPGASSLSVIGGGSSFLMDQQVRFQVTAWQTQLPITRYAWDLEYEPSLGFDETPGASINQTSWYYRSPGEYMACVRVYDANSYTERTLTLTVSNVPPTATVVARHTGPDDLTFDGANSQDTVSDRPYLEYRWNFGDGTGWTPWGLSSSVDHHYEADGSFRASQEVRDRWGEVDVTSCEVIVDTTAPTIDLDDNMVITKAYLGEELVIKVDVTDLSTISKVLLVYGWGEENRSLVMSRIAGTDTFVATIPQLTEVGPLRFHIEAEDSGGHSSLSATMNVSVVERPDDSWLPILGMAAIIASALLLLYFRMQNMVVDEVFMIYRDGNLMAHQTRRLKPGMDDQIMSSMLVAIQDFVRDSFKDEDTTGLNRMDFGERKVLVEKGENIYLAVVLHGKREGRVVNIMKDTIKHAESRYSEVLANWDGDLEKVGGIKEEANRLLRSGALNILSEGDKGTTDDEPRENT